MRSALSGLTLRTRLTAGALLALLGVVAAMGAVGLWRLSSTLDHELEEELQQATAAIAPMMRAGGAVDGDRADATGAGWQVLSQDGTVLAAGGPAPERPLVLPDALPRRGATTLDVATLWPTNKAPFRVRATAVGDRILVVAVRRELRDDTLHTLRTLLIAGGVLALAGAVALTVTMPRRALRPVEDYRRRAAELADRGSGRLEVPAGPPDEITRLGHTFNDLLGRLEALTTRERQFVADAGAALRGPLAAVESSVARLRRADATDDGTGDEAGEGAGKGAGEGAGKETGKETGDGAGEGVGDGPAAGGAALDQPETEAGDGAVVPAHVLERREALDDLAEEVAGLAALVEQLLELASPAPVDACRATEVVVGIVERENGLRPERRLVARLPAEDGGSETRVPLPAGTLERAVGALLDNAFAHGGPPVHLHLRAVGDHVVIAVSDAGDGMPPEMLADGPSLFVRAPRARRRRGAGLGLTLAQEAATSAGGQLRLCHAGHHLHHGPTQQVACDHGPEMTVSIVLPRAH